MARVTDESIRRAPRPASGQAFLWDDLVSGFGVRLTPSRAAYVVQWREADGSKKRETLRARWPEMSAVKAREAARARLAQVAATSATLGGQPLRLAMRGWYERQSEVSTWRPRYRAKVDAIIRTYVEAEDNPLVHLTPAARQAVEALGGKPVTAVTRSDVLRVVDNIKRGTADQFMAMVSSFYNWAYDRGIEVVNPARNRLRVTGGRRVRTRALTDEELLTVWRALEAEGDPAHTCLAVLAFTGCRRREATGMQWAELDLDAATWTLPPERRKTGNRDPHPFVIHLHPVLIAMLRRQPVLHGSPFVFWGRRDRRPFDFHHALMQRLAKLPMPEWRFHDIRRTVRSGMARLGVTQVVAEMCLGHVAKPGLVAVYDQHSYAAEMREAWQKWGDHVASLTRGMP
jgi:integrase